MITTMKKVIIPICDIRLQKKYENLNCEGLSVACKDVKRNRSRVQIKEESEEDDISYEVRKASVPKKKILKIFDVNPKEDDKIEDSDYEEDGESEDSDYEDNNESEDPDYEEENEKRGKRSIKKEVPDKTFPKLKRNLSAYEQIIQKNREEKMAFLQSIKIEEAKIDFSNAVDSKNRKFTVKRKYNKVASTSVLRKSRRLANFNVDLSEDALYLNALKVTKETKRCKKIIPAEMPFKDAFGDDLYESYIADISIQESKSNAKFITYNKSDLALNMTLAESNIAKITPFKITSLAWYPLPEQFILAAGDKCGYLGVWNVNNESNPYVANIHLKGITNLKFNPFNQVHLISSSYDGILRCGDMVQHKFNEIYNVSDKTRCTYFDILSETTFLVAQKDGQVALVDRRTKWDNSKKKHTCHDYSIQTVNIHPVNRSFFVSADRKGTIRLWDLRKLQTNPVAENIHHKQCVQSAYFSPTTGKSILATSSDDSISIFDCSDLTSKIQLKHQMKHNNRWNTPLRATWLPNSEEAFVIGSVDYPRKIEVYDKNMFAYPVIKNENLTSITSNNIFHPTRHALACGNCLGKVFVFT